MTKFAMRLMLFSFLVFGSLSCTTAETRSLPAPPIDPIKSGINSAVLAGGCFWGVEELIRKLPGVVSTEVGYTGGRVPNPTYERISTGATGHAESIRVEFNPAVLSYADLLRYFFRLHDPTTLNQQGNDRGTQYRSAIFFINDSQRETAELVIKEVDSSKKWSSSVVTQVVAAGEWYPAEEYHQEYLQKHPDGYTCHWVRD